MGLTKSNLKGKVKPSLNLKGSQGHNVELDKPLNQTLQSGLENISSMSRNGPPRNYYGALEMNLKTCAKGTKWRVYIWAPSMSSH